MPKKSHLEKKFLAKWESVAQPDDPRPVTEYYAVPKRRFRWDVAWPDHKILIEIQGGTWNGGAHGRGSGIRRDANKNNLAVAAGWRCFFVTPDLLREDADLLIAQIKGLMKESKRE